MLAFHLATGIAKYHQKRVLLIDVDHQSTLSILCLTGDEWKERDKSNLTINSIFTHFTDRLPLPGDEIIIKNPLTIRHKLVSEYDLLDLVPATLELDDTEIELASASTGDAIRSEWEKRTLLCKWFDNTTVNDDYDYIIIDCPPATKLATQNALAASHGYIIPVIPEEVIRRGVPHLRQLLSNRIEPKLRKYSECLVSFDLDISPSYISVTKLVGIVITRIQSSRAPSGYTNDHTENLNQMIKDWGDDLLEPYIPQGVGISESLRAGLPVYSRDYHNNIYRMGFVEIFKELIDKLVKKMDLL